MAFHLALVNNPQDTFVVLAFASILYHGEWKEGIRFARENAQVKVNFATELSGSFTFNSDEELAEEVSQLATFVQDSVDVLTETESLFESMSDYPTSPCSGLVSICNWHIILVNYTSIPSRFNLFIFLPFALFGQKKKEREREEKNYP